MANAVESMGITLLSSEGDPFPFSAHGIKLSSYVKSFVEENLDERELSVPIVESAILQKIVEFVNHHEQEPMRGIAKPLTGNTMANLVQPFYAEFVDSLSKDELAKMASAANFMGLSPLLHLCAAKIATYIRNKSPEEIRVNLGLSTNFTPEQAAKIAKENEWANDL